MAEQLTHEVLGELLGLLAHDLRNPLSALNSNLGFLGTEFEDTSGEAFEVLDDLQLSVDGLAQIIESLDLLGRHLRGEITHAPLPSPIPTLLAAGTDGMERLARSHGVEIVCEPVSLRLSDSVRTDRLLLGQALRALVRNAVQHAPAGSEVHLSVRRSDDGEVVFRVEDDGPTLATSDGIPTNPFSARGQVEGKGQPGARYGRGLGLFCARLCADAIGAELVGEERARGNVFELRLPGEVPSREAG